jgi:acyl-CoA thioester hydrolase
MTVEPLNRHTLKDRVQFVDTDMAGIVHFSTFFRYMERVEHDFFRSLGLSIWEDPTREPVAERVGWPRVHASCDYRMPLRFEEEFTMELLVEKLKTRSLSYRIRFWRGEDLCAEGKLIAACVQKDAEASHGMKAVAIPARIRSRLAVAAEFAAADQP